MLTVTVESGPRYLVRVAAPIIGYPPALVSDLELSALVLKRQADDQGADLGIVPRGVYVCLELCGRARVYLYSYPLVTCSRQWDRKGLRDFEEKTHVQLVQLRPQTPCKVGL